MRNRLLRYLLMLTLALFTLNGVAGVARGCTFGQRGPQQTGAHASVADASAHPCPDSYGETSCHAHSLQNAKSLEQKATSDLPALVFAPPYRVVRVSAPVEPTVVRVALTQPVFGPSLIVLYSHLRI